MTADIRDLAGFPCLMSQARYIYRDFGKKVTDSAFGLHSELIEVCVRGLEVRKFWETSEPKARLNYRQGRLMRRWRRLNRQEQAERQSSPEQIAFELDTLAYVEFE